MVEDADAHCDGDLVDFRNREEREMMRAGV